MIKKLLSIICLIASATAFGQTYSNPDSVTLHTEDITLFWKVFDETAPKFNANTFQTEYLDAGSPGLKGFINMRIESGGNLSKNIKKNLDYYSAVRESTLSITGKIGKLQEYFHALKKLYDPAVFPDVYFVIGVQNSGGTTFKGGLIIGAEMFGKETGTFKPHVAIEKIELVVVHELIHYQQNYTPNNTLLAQSIREGSADFICELVSGTHSNTAIHEYGNSHAVELWVEFSSKMIGTDWTPWLYSTKDKSRPKDLGYWMGYKIVKAYYDKAQDKSQAVHDILNITDFNEFLKKSGYGQ
jgi:hypothetical protein